MNTILILAGLILVGFFTIFIFILFIDKVSDRFSLMPTSNKLIYIIIILGINIYLIKNYVLTQNTNYNNNPFEIVVNKNNNLINTIMSGDKTQIDKMLNENHNPFKIIMNNNDSINIIVYVVIGFLTLYLLIFFVQFLQFYKIEQSIDNKYAIPLILKSCEKGYCCANFIADLLNLPKRQDYNHLIPKIIENLKTRNKLPYEIHISQGDVSSDELKNTMIKEIKQ